MTFRITQKRTYLDTLNLLVLSGSKPAYLDAFSISNIGGAYGDAGQNYKNIAVLVKSLGFAYAEHPTATGQVSCPVATSGAAGSVLMN